jgi:hypothetical protein
MLGKGLELYSKIIPFCAACTILLETNNSHLEIMIFSAVLLAFNILRTSLTKSYESWLGFLFNSFVYFYRIVAIFPFGEEEYLFTDNSPAPATSASSKKKDTEPDVKDAAQAPA